jgi:serine/threonine protein phosphatase PrpC
VTLRAAGVTDVGCQRDVNEDRFHVDPDRGVFIVVDGVGGQAAGGRAADTALDVVRARLANGNGAIATRLREAITAANNEVHRQALSRPEWRGMACVLTAAMVDAERHRAIIGHVGDTRLYKLRGGTIRKITPDHSPIGEREDAGEISEVDAMRHPRRNEVYRDVGSDPHEVGDRDFVDVRDTTMEPDAALLLCSDGLTDLVASDTIQDIVQQHAGRPDEVARALVKAANDAGGKDNVTVVYVEGEKFARSAPSSPTPAQKGRPAGSLAPDLPGRNARPGSPALKSRPTAGSRTVGVIVVLGLLLGLAFAWRAAGYPLPGAVRDALVGGPAGLIIVPQGDSISAAIDRAGPGTMIFVEPGEYRERLTLKGDVRLFSMVPRGAILRLPGSATDEDAAVVAVDVAYAEIAGFRVIGDAATPLGTGILIRSSNVRLIDVEITGAARTAVDIGPGDNVMLLASDIHDNPGAGLALRANASPRITHNTFGANGQSQLAASAMVIEPGARPMFTGNVFRNVDPKMFTLLDADTLAQLKSTNIFPDARPATASPGTGRGRGSETGRGRGPGASPTPRPGR